jgi:hypothetical protein
MTAVGKSLHLFQGARSFLSLELVIARFARILAAETGRRSDMTGDGKEPARPRSTAVWTKAQPPTYLEEKR